MSSIHEYQAGIKHRIKLVIPMTFEVESSCESFAEAQAEAIRVIAHAIRPEQITYRWNPAAIDNAEMAGIQFTKMALKPVPPEVTEPE